MLLLWAVVRPLSPSVFSTLLWDVVLLLSSPVFDLLWAIVTALRPLSSAVFSTLLWPSSDPSRSPVSRRCCEMSFFPSRHPSSLTLLWAVLVRLCSPTPFLSFAALPSWHHRYPPIHLTSLLPPAICSCRFGDHRPAYTTPL